MRCALLVVALLLAGCAPSCVVYQRQEQHTCPVPERAKD
jgi:hypothetical protein